MNLKIFNRGADGAFCHISYVALIFPPLLERQSGKNEPLAQLLNQITN